MAYSPTPQATGLPTVSQTGSSNPFYRLERKSPSPSSHQSALTKRDRRRMALQDRLAEISLNFAENRDANYRKQLQQYQADINFINNAQLYENPPVLEPGEEEGANTHTNGAAGVRQQLPSLANGNLWHDSLPKTGRHAARFMNEVNDTMEQRDVDLTASAYNFNFSIQQYEKDYKFAVEVAEREHQRLLKSLRQQLIANVQQKKATLHREKEKLDIADTNALLHYPNQFNINHTASPGGPQSNRKTRHTRHRLDADDLDTAINNSTTNGKRKRKTAIDGETGGSPGPTQFRETEQVTTNGFKEVPSRPEVQSATPSAYTLNRLFTDRELNANLQEATYEVIRSHTSLSANNSASNSKSPNKRRKPNLAVPTDALQAPATADPTDLEDNASIINAAADTNTFDGITAPDTLTATAMDRTPSQLYHGTRSAGRLQTATADPTSNLGELAGRQSAADLIGSYTRANEKPKKADGDDYQRAPPLSDQEALNDVRLMEKAMRRIDASIRRGSGGEGNDDDQEHGLNDDEDYADEDLDEDAGLGGRAAAAAAAAAAARGRERAVGVDRMILELAVGEAKEDFVGPIGFGTVVGDDGDGIGVGVGPGDGDEDGDDDGDGNEDGNGNGNGRMEL